MKEKEAEKIVSAQLALACSHARSAPSRLGRLTILLLGFFLTCCLLDLPMRPAVRVISGWEAGARI